MNESDPLIKQSSDRFSETIRTTVLTRQTNDSLSELNSSNCAILINPDGTYI